MCTVSWIQNSDRYHLLCNRDEKRTRKRAMPPQFKESLGTRYLAPTDGDSGGSWIAANQYGLSLCLLNGDQLPAPPDAMSHRRSRGLLLLDLIPLASLADLRGQIVNSDLSCYAPFTLLALELGLPALVGEWNGRQNTLYELASPVSMLTSSSFDTVSVRNYRQERFNATAPSLTELSRFHRSHSAGPSAYSICMHRADAETVSLSQVCMTAHQVEFVYTPAAPCRSAHAATSCHRLIR
jgi:hypothetical protein